MTLADRADLRVVPPPRTRASSGRPTLQEIRLIGADLRTFVALRPMPCYEHDAAPEIVSFGLRHFLRYPEGDAIYGMKVYREGWNYDADQELVGLVEIP